ncbi:OmpA family protein [Arenimonas caeni]|jgi:outer membrane protein OmpA-like peptidoglycan-associated protein|uniref:OmpA family protein n=1 Tax=Arenimonas caeni TaxID=2058085 RepID=UPI002A36A203|nr:OmpA family protein [Arenimonas caeni]MDY0021763.1 OmpA family protein [Arenimonas caeni]
MAIRFPVVLALALLLALPAAAQTTHDEAVAVLAADLQALEADPSLGGLARLERLQARQALAEARDARRRDREHKLALAGVRLEAARLAAEAELLAEQAAQLDRERDQIMIEASRLEAERARRESERLRLQALAREEALQRELEQSEADRVAALEAAQAETEQARKLAAARAREAELARREAELAAAIAADEITDAAPPPVRRDGDRRIYTLAGNAFPSGSASLTAQAQASLRALAGLLAGGGAITIEGHTDSQGADAANQALSQRRAEAVRRVLEESGVAPGRMKAVGLGEGKPVADNASAAGRALNRRVEIIAN